MICQAVFRKYRNFSFFLPENSILLFHSGAAARTRRAKERIQICSAAFHCVIRQIRRTLPRIDKANFPALFCLPQKSLSPLVKGKRTDIGWHLCKLPGVNTEIRAQRQLRAHGVPFDDHRARQMTRADNGAYDLLVGMDGSNLAAMRRICGGDPDGKLRLLMEYTRTPRDVADPWYSGDFDAAWRDIESGCRALLDALRPSL